MKIALYLAAATAVVTLALGVMNAQAQQAETTPQVETEAAQSQTLDESKLKSFAVAFLEVAKVNSAYRPQIEAAPNAEDQQRLEHEAGTKMAEAVDAADDITVDEYNQIIEAAQVDPDLAKRINGHIAEAAGVERAEQPAPAE